MVGIADAEGTLSARHAGYVRAVQDELVKNLKLATPLIVSYLGEFVVQFITLAFVGHVSKVDMGGAAMGQLLINLLVLAPIIGVSGALETLLSQVHGHDGGDAKLGTMLSGSAVLYLMLSPLFVLALVFTEDILLAVGQDTQVSAKAYEYNIRALSCLPALMLIECLRKLLVCQNIAFPVTATQLVATALHFLWCAVLIPQHGAAGAALSLSITYWLAFLLLAGYAFFTGHLACLTATPSRTAYLSATWVALRELCILALPSVVTTVIEWGAFETTNIMAGNLGVVPLDVHEALLSVAGIVWSIPLAASVAVSVRVGNYLGAGDAAQAKITATAGGVFAVISGVVCTTALFILRPWLPAVFTGNGDVQEAMSAPMVLLALLPLTDAPFAWANGTLRGMGRQRTAAGFNFAAYWVVGIPLAALLAFPVHIGVVGLWVGLVTGVGVSTLCITVFLYCWVDWEKQAVESQRRVGRVEGDDTSSDGDEVPMASRPADV